MAAPSSQEKSPPPPSSTRRAHRRALPVLLTTSNARTRNERLSGDAAGIINPDSMMPARRGTANPHVELSSGRLRTGSVTATFLGAVAAAQRYFATTELWISYPVHLARGRDLVLECQLAGAHGALAVSTISLSKDREVTVWDALVVPPTARSRSSFAVLIDTKLAPARTADPVLIKIRSAQTVRFRSCALDLLE